MYNCDREIMNANTAIEEELSEITNENRGKIARRILKSTRDLNDNIAYKIFKETYPEKEASVKNVAKEFANIKKYKFISQFNNYLQKVVSHFTPTDDGAERLILKYYKYLLKLKNAMKDRFNIDILRNIDNFLLDLDRDTDEFYEKVACEIEFIKGKYINKKYDNFYIYKNKPFIFNRKVYYEISFELAHNKQNKFNRITAFTDFEIDTQYAVALSFYKTTINILGENIPILIINDWNVSIRPCEFQNLGKIFGFDFKVDRSHKEYVQIMALLKNEKINLLDIVLMKSNSYNSLKENIENETKSGISNIFLVLDYCRKIIKNEEIGSKILRYILYNMNNRLIKTFYHKYEKLNDLCLKKKCFPFEKNPFCFNPPGHITNLYDILQCIEPEGHEFEFIVRKIKNNTNQKGILYTNFDDLIEFGTRDEIEKSIQFYNSILYYSHKPNAEIGIYNNYVYNVGYENDIKSIIDELLKMSTEENLYSSLFEKEKIDELKNLENNNLDSEDKEIVLSNMINNSRVYIVYGAAGTGKTTLTNLISNLFEGKKRLYLSKTNAAINNLKNRIRNKDNDSLFLTIDSFLADSSYYKYYNYDLIVVDECSTVTNEEILKILRNITVGMVILTGDIYQIESIGYGSWFKISRHILPKSCQFELTIPHRTSQEDLNELWNEVRNMGEDNKSLEFIVKNNFTEKLDKSIFQKKCTDEIILCLNYNGLYGLNNINKFMQINNTGKSVEIGEVTYKEGDKILFNDSNRFELLQNNMKGEIVKITESDNYISFTVSVNEWFTKEDVETCDGLTFVSHDEKTTIVEFIVKKYPPYYHDQEHEELETIIPFQVSYAVSIHKSQGLEYDSVKIIITDESEEQITHDIFYTAITRARKKLTIYWSPEVCNRVLSRVRPRNDLKDFNILKNKYNL